MGYEIPPQVNMLEYTIDSIDSLDADRSSIFSIHGKDSSSLPVLSLHELFELDPARVLLESQPSFPDSITSVASSESDNLKVPFANSNVTEIMILARQFTQNVIWTKQLLIPRTRPGREYNKYSIAGLGVTFALA